ncbi:MAG: hypothetical protein AAGG02_21645, partial [Cyanobacteria bacterium P01_H01_bin.15]
ILVVYCALYPYLLQATGFVFPDTRYVVGNYPSLYRFLQSQPVNSLTAALLEEANNIPSFAARPIFPGGQGFLLPYHKKYFAQMNQRVRDTMMAQYTDHPATLLAFLEKYPINFWLLHDDGDNPDFLLQKHSIFSQYPDERLVIHRKLSAGVPPIIKSVRSTCEVWREDAFFLLDTSCVKRALR